MSLTGASAANSGCRDVPHGDGDEITHAVDQPSRQQTFTTRRLDDDQLLDEGGLTLTGFLGGARTWAAATDARL